MTELSTNLVIRGEAVQALYSQYSAGHLVVNRRYQRKLVWSIEEKQAFIDSLVRRLPVPLILAAERTTSGGTHLEIIDGLQRLEAVFAFVNNAYPLEGHYFDLETLAETKQALDNGSLLQRHPTLSREQCTQLAGYNLPISVYRASDDETVDDVFRRINSGGRHLSRQEIRQAGSLSNFAELVREVAASVRGDYSVGDIIDLKRVPAISITSVPDGPGVFVDTIFWVRNRILTREQVRESRDEEIIADLLASMLIEPVPPYDSRVLDQFYGLDQTSESRQDRIEAVLQRDSPDDVKARFAHIISTITQLCDGDGNQFSNLIFEEPRQRVPRYFEAVFLGLDTLLIGEQRQIDDFVAARAALRGIGSRHIDIPSGGGTWRADSKRSNAEVVAGLLRPHTKPLEQAPHPALERNALQIENLLRAAIVENSLIDFKQGLSNLTDPPELDDNNVQEVLKTASAMANHGRGASGFIIIGIADTHADAERIRALSGVAPVEVSGRLICGIDVDLAQAGSLDDLLLWFTNTVRASENVDNRLASQLLRDLRAVVWSDRTVLLLKVETVGVPIPFGDAFHERLGSETVEVPPSEVATLFARF
jgi:hypothetical protein